MKQSVRQWHIWVSIALGIPLLLVGLTTFFIAHEKDELTKERESAQRLLDIYIAKKLDKNLTLRLTGGNLLDTNKLKTKPEYYSNGTLKKQTLENERGAIFGFIALEGTW